MGSETGPKNSPLTPDTRWLIERMFKPGDQAEAAATLEKQIGSQLPSCEKAASSDFERLRFAAIKVSGGSLKRLHHAVREAQIDWRDLLMAADFGFRVTDHRAWFEALRRGG